MGKHDENGHYAELHLRGFTDKAEAAEWSAALYRCAHYLNRTGQAAVSMSAKVERDGRGYMVVYHAIDKTHARAHVIAKYGPDRSKWPYDPRRRETRA